MKLMMKHVTNGYSYPPHAYFLYFNRLNKWRRRNGLRAYTAIKRRGDEVEFGFKQRRRNHAESQKYP